MLMSFPYIRILRTNEPTIGRPTLDVDISEVEALRELNFSWTKIADILGVSRATLYRKVEESGVSTNDRSTISDGNLDNIVVGIKRDQPHDREVLLQGHLLRKSIRVNRKKLRQSIHRMDHENTIARQANVVRRRVRIHHSHSK